jgi:hypothetical protein
LSEAKPGGWSGDYTVGWKFHIEIHAGWKRPAIDKIRSTKFHFQDTIFLSNGCFNAISMARKLNSETHSSNIIPCSGPEIPPVFKRTGNFLQAIDID